MIDLEYVKEKYYAQIVALMDIVASIDEDAYKESFILSGILNDEMEKE